MTLIGLVANKQHGKDTTYEYIRQLYHTLQVVRVAFADPLYNEVARATGLSVGYIKAHKDNFRLILQGWGTDYRRRLCGDDYWVKKMIDHLQGLTADLVVVTDVRFLSEAKVVTSVGGHLIRIVRPSLQSADQHESETEMNKIMVDAIINNDGSLGELKSAVRQCMKQLSERTKLIV